VRFCSRLPSSSLSTFCVAAVTIGVRTNKQDGPNKRTRRYYVGNLGSTNVNQQLPTNTDFTSYPLEFTSGYAAGRRAFLATPSCRAYRPRPSRPADAACPSPPPLACRKPHEHLVAENPLETAPYTGMRRMRPTSYRPETAGGDAVLCSTSTRAQVQESRWDSDE
jgi:hypothetical protein